MADPMTRRTFTAMAAGLGAAAAAVAQDRKYPPKPAGPTAAPFERDYPAPGFKPSWKKPQLNRLMVQDFVVFAHSDLAMVKKMLDKEPMLATAVMDWGGG